MVHFNAYNACRCGYALMKYAAPRLCIECMVYLFNVTGAVLLGVHIWG